SRLRVGCRFALAGLIWTRSCQDAQTQPNGAASGFDRLFRYPYHRTRKGGSMQRWGKCRCPTNGLTFIMPVPGGALIRHVEKSEDGDVAVAVCFVPNADGKSAFQPAQFPLKG